MTRMITIIFVLASLVVIGQVKYTEEWILGRSRINYGRPIDTDVFPYHPSQKEFYHAVTKGAEVAFTIKVMDEKRNPIEDANVVCLLELDDAFNQAGKNYTKIDKFTDANGFVFINGKCDGFACFNVKKTGWYKSSYKDMYFFYMNNYSLQDGKWQPYGLTHEVVLRPIKMQIPMYNPQAGYVGKLPAMGISVGIDLFMYDWVAPYGKGKTIDFFLQYDIIENKEGKCETLTFTFPNKGDGIYRSQCMKWSDFRTDYEASEDSSMYLDTMKFHREVKYVYMKNHRRGEFYEERLVFQNDIGYEDYLVLRTRTKLDENGNVTYCHYSKIINPIKFAGGKLWIEWFTNPTPNDSNLEELSGVLPQ